MAQRQHYIPKFLLEYFTDECGRFHCFRRSNNNGKFITKTPENFFVETGIFTAELEKRFSILEGRISGFISKIVDSVNQGRIPEISVQEKQSWIEFVAYSARRSPEVARTETDVFMNLLSSKYDRSI